MQASTAPPTYESEILDHLGLVAGMYDELEIGEGNLRFPASTPALLKTSISEKSLLGKPLRRW